MKLFHIRCILAIQLGRNLCQPKSRQSGSPSVHLLLQLNPSQLLSKKYNFVKNTPARASRQVAESKRTADADSPSDGNISPGNIKRKTYSFTMPKVEHEAIVALKQKLSDIVGLKIRKSDIVRASMLIFLSQPDSKIRASLGKISAIDGSTEGQKK